MNDSDSEQSAKQGAGPHGPPSPRDSDIRLAAIVDRRAPSPGPPVRDSASVVVLAPSLALQWTSGETTFEYCGPWFVSRRVLPTKIWPWPVGVIGVSRRALLSGFYKRLAGRSGTRTRRPGRGPRRPRRTRPRCAPTPIGGSAPWCHCEVTCRRRPPPPRLERWALCPGRGTATGSESAAWPRCDCGMRTRSHRTEDPGAVLSERRRRGAVLYRGRLVFHDTMYGPT